MRITIRAMCQIKRDNLKKQFLQCRLELSKISPVILIHDSQQNSRGPKLFNNLHQLRPINLNN